MTADEREIRDLVAKWHAASQAGDVDTVLSLMTDDVVFLRPGCPPMSKREFEMASRVAPGSQPPKIEAKSEIEEIQLAGDWAFMISKTSVRVTLPSSNQPMHRAGHTLTVFQKVDRRWLLARDANLLVAIAEGK